MTRTASKPTKTAKAIDISATGQRREQALEAALKQIEKNFGVGSIMRLADNQIVAVDCIPTGALSLDLALGGRGMPRGRICELFGPEGSGKTTLALNIIASSQRGGGVAVSNALEVVVIDSVAALIPQAEIDGDMGATHIGLQARLMSQAMRKLTGAIAKSRTCVIFINQIRMRIGVMFGNPETTPGGRALKFYSSVRLDIRRVNTIKEGEQAVGTHVRARVVKNKIAAPFKTAEFDIMFDSGISAEGDLLDLAVTHNIVDKQGAWFSYGAIRLGQGRENSKRYLVENKDTCEEIRAAVIEKATQQ